MPDKIGMIPSEGVENQGFIRLWDFCIGETPLICEIHFCWNCAGVESRHLGVKLQIDGFRGLDTNDKLVARNVFENALRYVFELNTDFDFCFVEGCSRLRTSDLQKIAETIPFPAFRMKGTPSHRGLLIQSVVAAKVGQTELGGTVSSS